MRFFIYPDQFATVFFVNILAYPGLNLAAAGRIASLPCSSRTFLVILALNGCINENNSCKSINVRKSRVRLVQLSQFYFLFQYYLIGLRQRYFYLMVILLCQ